MLLGILWILFSDKLAATIATDQSAFAKISLFKGWGYVIVTALLLLWLIWRYSNRLVSNDELLQLTGEMAKVGGWEFDAQSLQGTWTDEVARIHDLDPSLPTNVELGLSFYTGDSREKIEQAVNEAIEQAKPYDLELELITAKGLHKWIRTMALPVLQNGKVVKVRGIFQDITERKTIEATLKESEERFRSLYENSTIGMYRTTPDGRILLCNPALLQMLGYDSFEELAHRNLEEEGYEPGFERSEFREKLERQGEVRGFESAWNRRDGSTVYVRESAKTIRDPDGKIQYYEGTVEDITDRKVYEEELKRSNAELEQFAYVASHDLQEPLRAITGLVQLLQKHYQGKLDERADEYIVHVVEAAGRMQTLINDLLAYSRVDRRGNPFNRTDFGKALDIALTNLQVAIQESNANITNDELPTLMADATQVSQVFQNLIGNAIKFREKGQPLRIHIGTREMENAWRFEVRDNGIGIEPQFYERIFGVFQRLHTRLDYPGTGIGLSLCKKIVERHGGHIWVESEVGRGSSFYFTIPHRR
jgi:PAS domain S-box-containing protein